LVTKPVALSKTPQPPQGAKPVVKSVHGVSGLSGSRNLVRLQSKKQPPGAIEKQMRDTMETTTKTLPSVFGVQTTSTLRSTQPTLIGESQVPSRVTTRTTIRTQVNHMILSLTFIFTTRFLLSTLPVMVLVIHTLLSMTFHLQDSQASRTTELLERIAHLENKVTSLEKSGVLTTVDEGTCSEMPSFAATEEAKTKSMKPKLNFAKEFTSRIKTPKICFHNFIDVLPPNTPYSPGSPKAVLPKR